MNKLTALAVKDFQSFKNANIPLGRFTAVVGASNLGKSALIRALKALAHNAASTGLVRQGSKEFRVEVAFDDATSTTLSKGAKRSEFSIVDGEGLETSFPKAGANSVPDEIAELWNLSDLSFTSQHDKPFLLAEPPSEIARVLGELTNVSLLMEAVRETNRFRTEALNIVKARDKEAEECRSQILTHSNLTAKLDYLAKARKEFDDTQEIDIAYQALKSLVDNHVQIDSMLTSIPVNTDLEIGVGSLDKLIETQKILHFALTNHQQAISSASLAKSKMQTLQNEINTLHDSIHELMQQAGQCPYCGRKFNE